MRIIIACSGTGGHLFAGLSIAEVLKNRLPDVELFFFSSDYLKAHRLIESTGFRFYRIHAKGLLNRSLGGIIRFLIGQVLCLVQSGWLLMFIRPSLVIGTGGFASAGVICWSWLFGIPSVVHEQNLIPGKANRLLAPLVDKILVSFEGSKQYFKRYTCTVTGMPLRFKGRLNKVDIHPTVSLREQSRGARPPMLRSPTLQSLPARSVPAKAGSGDGASSLRSHFGGVGLRRTRIELGLVPGRFTILVMGGSRGAHKINRLMVDTVEKLTDYRDRIQFVHLTGTQDYEFVKEAYMRCGFKAYVEGFSTRMETIYSSTDLVISRSGSGSLSEITFFGLPAILIPYPYSRDKHQLKNAQVLAEKNAAIVITEDAICDDRLVEVLTELVNQPERLNNMARQSQSLAKSDAAEAVVEEILEVIK